MPSGRREKLGAVIGELREQLDELEKLSVRGSAGSRRLGLLLESGRDPGPCLRDMEEIDERILAISARGIAGFLIQSVIHGILGEGGSRPESRAIVARSEAMYAGIEESSAWQRKLLLRAADALTAASERPTEGEHRPHPPWPPDPSRGDDRFR